MLMLELLLLCMQFSHDYKALMGHPGLYVFWKVNYYIILQSFLPGQAFLAFGLVVPELMIVYSSARPTIFGDVKRISG